MFVQSLDDLLEWVCQLDTVETSAARDSESWERASPKKNGKVMRFQLSTQLPAAGSRDVSNLTMALRSRRRSELE
jgi:hypothetical protein